SLDFTTHPLCLEVLVFVEATARSERRRSYIAWDWSLDQLLRHLFWTRSQAQRFFDWVRCRGDGPFASGDVQQFQAVGSCSSERRSRANCALRWEVCQGNCLRRKQCMQGFAHIAHFSCPLQLFC